ncbi:hypothetical protein V1502_16970 [Bacillus sp. SCS-153A]|uniref:hypothetical protein n=1 Tax=Rossellomorea sedimentorum TaxID=3115294 RepID=UPI003905BF7B
MKKFAILILPPKPDAPEAMVWIKEVKGGFNAETTDGEVMVQGRYPVETAKVCYEYVVEDFLERKRKYFDK